VAEFVQVLACLLGDGAAADTVASFEELDGYQEIQASFQASLVARFDELGAGIAHERWGEVAALAHRLKGSAGSFGFPGVTRVAAHVEGAALHSDRQGARKAFEQLIALEELKQVDTAGAVKWEI
jgi:HPt (histidine-containing phosphotransfer) domain-containing protein